MAASAWAAAWVATRLPLPALVAVDGVLAMVGCVVVCSRARWAATVAASCWCAVAAALSSGLHAEAVRHGPLVELAGRRAAVRVVVEVTGDPVLHSGQAVGSVRRADLVVVYATVREMDAGSGRQPLHSPVVMLATGDTGAWSRLLPTERVDVTARLAPAAAHDAGVAAVLDVRGSPEVVRGPTSVQRVAAGLRAGLRRAVSPLPESSRGLLPGLVLGDTSGLDPELAADFRTAGLTHLVAVSGANIAIVFAGVLVVMRALRIPRRLGLLLSGAVLGGFVVVVRPQPSVLRAAVMAAVVLLAALSGRPRSALPALWSTILILVLLDPSLAGSVGFALSVAATAAILLVAPGWRDRLARRLPRRVAEGVAVAAAAQLACGPLIAAFTGQLSLVAIPANLLAEPAVPFATVLGVAATAVAPLWAGGARVLARLAGIPAGWLVIVATRAAHAPAAAVPWPSGVAGAALLALVTVIAVATVLRRRTRWLAASVVIGVVLAAVGARALLPGWPPPRWVFVACDVGQGDALVLAAGPSTAVVVDAGPDPLRVDGCLRRLGVQRVALMVLSHLHADHVEGLPGVLRGRRVDALVYGSLEEPPTERTRALGWARAAGVPVGRLTAGDQLHVGAVSADVLAPRVILHGTDSDPNNDSLVLRVTDAGVTLLLSGDVEQPAQEALLRSGVPVTADVLKVPHHGSANQDPALLAAVGGRVAVTSVGAGNDYGHPAPQTMAAVAADGMRSYRTDRDGSVAVALQDGRLVTVGTAGSGTPPAAAAAGAGAALARRPAYRDGRRPGDPAGPPGGRDRTAAPAGAVPAATRVGLGGVGTVVESGPPVGRVQGGPGAAVGPARACCGVRPRAPPAASHQRW